MAKRNVILLHILSTDAYEFYGSPASLYDKHTKEDLHITKWALNNFFSKRQKEGFL